MRLSPRELRYLLKQQMPWRRLVEDALSKGFVRDDDLTGGDLHIGGVPFEKISTGELWTFARDLSLRRLSLIFVLSGRWRESDASEDEDDGAEDGGDGGEAGKRGESSVAAGRHA